MKKVVVAMKDRFSARYLLAQMVVSALIISFLGVSASTLARENRRLELLTKALEAQDQGRDDAAIELYREVIQDGLINGHLFYNLGISYYKSARMGEAMAAFLAAQRYLPRHPDVRANVKFVQSKIGDKLEAERPAGFMARVYRITDWFTKKEIAYLALLSTLIISVVTLVGIFYQKYRVLTTYGWMSFLIPCALCFMLMLKWIGDPRWGAIRSNEGAKVYSGPGENHTLLFTLQVGAPIFLSGQERQNYLPIEISDGKKGWVSANQVAFFGE